MVRPIRLAHAVAALAALTVFVPAPAPRARAASDSPRELPGPIDPLYAVPGDLNYAYGPTLAQRNALSAANASATIQVTYDAGFAANPQAQAAFQAAIDIWANIITSPVPIRVTAEFRDLGSASLLGQAQPGRICTSSAGVANTFYAAALADKFAGADVCATAGAGLFDIEADFNSAFLNWEFGTGGTPVSGKYNFMTVVLHELCHGLGFFGSGAVSGGVGFIGEAGGSIPDIFDRFVFNGSGQPILGFTSGTSALAAQLVSDNLFFTGANARSFNSGVNPKIESKLNPFQGGSSYSHTDDTTYSGTPNGLMTWALASAEVYTDPGPIVRGIFADEGWGTSSAPCTYSISPASSFIALAGGTGNITVTAPAGCAWTAVSNNTSFLTISSGAAGSGSGTVAYNVASLASGQRTGTITITGSNVFTLTQTGLPIMTLSPSTVNFGTINNGGTLGATTPAQALTLTQAGSGTVTWTATKSQPWITLSPTSGSGPATINVSINNAGGVLPAAGSLSGTVTVTTGGASANDPTANVNLTVLAPGQATAAAGVFETPVNGAANVVGSVPVTGWVIDDIGLQFVRISRAPVAGEGGAPIFIGDATFVSGARPDVAGLNPTKPLKDQAGWGYLLLTNFLPSQGNGTFTLFATAVDIEGNSTLLGSKVITCTNATATEPFGAIDTPGQGQTVSGSVLNFGWVLTPQPASINTNASTINVIVDSAFLGPPNEAGTLAPRVDIQTLFAGGGYANINNSVGVKTINTTTLANGVHTIAWIVTDSLGRAAGIGSRFFTVANSSVVAGVQTTAAHPSTGSGGAAESGAQSTIAIPVAQSFSPAIDAIGATQGFSRAVDAIPVAQGFSPAIDAQPKIVGSAAAIAGIASSPSAVAVTHGYDAGAVPELATPDHASVRHVRTAQLELVRIDLRAASDGDETRYRGYTRDGETLRALPIGSHLDERTGEFVWAPPLAFGGTHDLVFIAAPRTDQVGPDAERIEVRIDIDAQKSNAGDPRLVIDMPGSGAMVAQPFTIAGWALDPRGPANGAGIDTLHVWAYPLAGGDPIWVGVAGYGGFRPDVAELFGPRFGRSGYTIEVAGLAPGTYDLVVYAHSIATGSFTIARPVRVTVQ